MDFLPSSLQGLSPYRQFICYVLLPSRHRVGKTDKIPVNARGNLIDAHDVANWITANEAIETAKRLGQSHGVGFVLTEGDPFFCIDVDSCADTTRGEWSPIARLLLDSFRGAAVEVSSSGQGLHILGSGTVTEHNCVNKELHLEFYTRKRFIALTGIQASGDILTDCTPILPWLTENFFKSKTVNTEIGRDWWSCQPHEDYRGLDDDDKLLQMALNSKSARSVFGNAASFADLFDSNETVLRTAYPDPTDHACGYDSNSADLALAQHLSFWTGNNAERMQRLMLRSKLMREKWNRPDYLPRTIRAACAQQERFLYLEPSAAPPTAVEIPPEAAAPAADTELSPPGKRFIPLEDQCAFFRGCVYILGEHKILIPGGDLLTSDRFKAYFGGHSFPLDAANEKITRNAWDAFTDSQAFRHPRAHVTCFRPDLKPGEIIEENGRRMVNQWWPLKIVRKMGDIAPFTNHLAKIIPDDRDREILLSYLAAVVQYQGIKFQWCPYIQGVEGNGKSLLTLCVAYAVGYRYCHFPKAAELIGRHNTWEYGKILIGVEDASFGSYHDEVMEALKPMITNELREIEPKFVDKFMTRVCNNYIINSNHKDGIRKTMNDRRFAVFFTPQQEYGDLERDGMLGDYFQKYYAWLKAEGYAIIAEYLYNYPISPEFNPAKGCDRAPFTTATKDAIGASISGVEQEILEAIAQHRPGFKGGWVSSTALDILLTQLHVNRQIPHNKRRDLMRHLGYDYHPALKDGRVYGMLSNGEGRPRLFITFDHAVQALFGAKEISNAYVSAQGESVG